jgi:ssDNA-binding Zn-finger/Zn-ribbon topoisomerase 1
MTKMWDQIGEIVPGEYIRPKCPRCGSNDMHLGNTDFVWCATCGYSDEPEEKILCPNCGSTTGVNGYTTGGDETEMYAHCSNCGHDWSFDVRDSTGK